MPILRIGGRLAWFAHVPKCAGTSVEAYLSDRFGPMALLDTDHVQVDPARRWTRTSPQHVDVATFVRLFPAGFFDVTFTVVRHPVARIASAYRFQRDVMLLVDKDVSLTSWLEGLDDDLAADPFAYDNHVRPMVDMVPPDAVVFRLEDGLEGLVEWLDEVEGDRRGPRSLPRLNTGRSPAAGSPAPEAVALIAERYAADFQRFGYDPHAPVPARPPRAPSRPLLQRLRRTLRPGGR